MQVFRNLGTPPEQGHERHVPFPVALESGVLAGVNEVNPFHTAAMMVRNGQMPERKGLVGNVDHLAGYDLVGSVAVDGAECIFTTIKTTAVDNTSRNFQDTGIITFTTEQGKVKLVGAVVDERHSFAASKYGQVFNVGRGLCQVTFRFGTFPEHELISVDYDEIRTRQRRVIY